MSKYPNAQFISSANAIDQFVSDQGTEVAFAGRSNAGKSSAINTIINRRKFARTSKAPGRTRLVNFFSLRGDTRIVDLPGYGFARVSDSVRQHWGDLLSTYFKVRRSLTGLFLIIDCRRGLSDFNRKMFEFTRNMTLPIHVLLTKSDKLKKIKAKQALYDVTKELQDLATIQLFSSHNNPSPASISSSHKHSFQVLQIRKVFEIYKSKQS